MGAGFPTMPRLVAPREDDFRAYRAQVDLLYYGCGKVRLSAAWLAAGLIETIKHSFMMLTTLYYHRLAAEARSFA